MYHEPPPHAAVRSGAGCMVMCRRSGKFLFCLRPEGLPAGGTWSLWGGKSEGRETPSQTAVREVREETGHDHSGDVSHLRHMDTRTFVYDTFLMVVDEEFQPRISSECQAFVWVPLEDIPRPLHWGLRDLLSDRTAVSLLAKAVESQSGRHCLFQPLAAD